MLESVVSILNTGFNTINYILLISYSLGKIIVELIFVLYKLLYSLFSGLAALLVVIYEDTTIFSLDFIGNFHALNGVIRDGLINVEGVLTGIYDNLIYLAITGNLKISDFNNSLKNGALHLLNHCKNMVVLLGHGCWFVLTLIPNLIVSLVTTAYKMSHKLIVAFYVMLKDSLQRLSLAGEQMVLFILDVPLKSAIGLVFLYILFKYRRIFGRFMFAIIRKIYNIVRLIYRRFIQTITPIKRKPVSLPPPDRNDTRADGESLGACVICQDRVKSVLIMPCGHLCLCRDCCGQVTRFNQRQCPLCRMVIQKFIHVYV